MTTFILLASIIVSAIVAWLLRSRLAQYLKKDTVMTVGLFSSIAVLLVIALLPDIAILISTMKLMPPALRIVLVIAAAGVAFAGCSKQASEPKPKAINWSAPEIGYHATTAPSNKEGP